MSQKSTRRARRQTNDEDPTTLKAPTPKPNGIEESPPTPEEKPEENPKEATPPSEPPPVEQPSQPEPSATEENPPKNRTPTPAQELTNGREDEDLDSSPKEEMEPLVVTDEPDPELVFEDNSDLESGRESPVNSRCRTRRSQSRNIPTPKTPKEDTPKEEEQEDLSVGFDSENASTKAEAGGDSTRLNYTESILENNSFLQETKNKSFGETLRRLSTRRTIRPISDDYRKRLLQMNIGKNDLGMYSRRDSVERVSVGLKRKNCSEDEEDFAKRFKDDSPGFFARFTSPLASIRNTFRADVASSTPKLTGYKDEKCLIEDGENAKMLQVNDGERRWCLIM